MEPNGSMVFYSNIYKVLRNTDGGQNFSFLKTKQKYLESEKPDMAEISSILSVVLTKRSAAWLIRRTCKYLIGVV